MTFLKGGAKKRRDVAEKPIVDALRGCGAEVYQISGRGLPDLLVRFQGRWQPLGVKSKGGALTDTEKAGVSWPLVKTFDEAAVWVGIKAG